MNYCKVNQGVATKYTLLKLRKEYPNISFPKRWFDGSLDAATLNEKLVEYNIFPYVTPDQPSFDPLSEKVQKGDILLASGEWVLQWIVVPLDEDELAQASKQSERDAKLAGVEYEGVMCSATRDDMTGLNAVEDYVIAGNDINFEFSNGNVLVLTITNITDFRNTWVPFRASFF